MMNEMRARAQNIGAGLMLKGDEMPNSPHRSLEGSKGFADSPNRNSEKCSVILRPKIVRNRNPPGAREMEFESYGKAPRSPKAILALGAGLDLLCSSSARIQRGDKQISGCSTTKMFECNRLFEFHTPECSAPKYISSRDFGCGAGVPFQFLSPWPKKASEEYEIKSEKHEVDKTCWNGSFMECGQTLNHRQYSKFFFQEDFKADFHSVSASSTESESATDNAEGLAQSFVVPSDEDAFASNSNQHTALDNFHKPSVAKFWNREQQEGLHRSLKDNNPTFRCSIKEEMKDSSLEKRIVALASKARSSTLGNQQTSATAKSENMPGLVGTESGGDVGTGTRVQRITRKFQYVRGLEEIIHVPSYLRFAEPLRDRSKAKSTHAFNYGNNNMRDKTEEDEFDDDLRDNQSKQSCDDSKTCFEAQDVLELQVQQGDESLQHITGIEMTLSLFESEHQNPNVTANAISEATVIGETKSEKRNESDRFMAQLDLAKCEAGLDSVAPFLSGEVRKSRAAMDLRRLFRICSNLTSRKSSKALKRSTYVSKMPSKCCDNKSTEGLSGRSQKEKPVNQFPSDPSEAISDKSCNIPVERTCHLERGDNLLECKVTNNGRYRRSAGSDVSKDSRRGRGISSLQRHYRSSFCAFRHSLSDNIRDVGCQGEKQMSQTQTNPSNRSIDCKPSMKEETRVKLDSSTEKNQRLGCIETASTLESGALIQSENGELSSASANPSKSMSWLASVTSGSKEGMSIVATPSKEVSTLGSMVLGTFDSSTQPSSYESEGSEGTSETSEDYDSNQEEEKSTQEDIEDQILEKWCHNDSTEHFTDLILIPIIVPVAQSTSAVGTDSAVSNLYVDKAEQAPESIRRQERFGTLLGRFFRTRRTKI